jgi:xanthine dehydrogenase accessory factor
MSSADVHERAGQLRRDRIPFVHARVIRAEKPTSAKPGDEALILPGGNIEGFVGGTCAESTVRAQALVLLDSGETRLLRITPHDESGRPLADGTVVAFNPCLSGGALEIFLEPVVPPPLVVVVGDTPIARALMALGKPLGYDVLGYDSVDSLGGASAVVVASHGRGEEAALRAALDAGVTYVGLVASRKRGEAVLAGLGDDTARLVHSPAGLDIGAVSPEEVALSILAEIVAVRMAAGPCPPGIPPHGWGAPTPIPVGQPAETAIDQRSAPDPVCGMEVPAVVTSLHLDHHGGRYWFCGTGCLRAFSADPTAYSAKGPP